MSAQFPILSSQSSIDSSDAVNSREVGVDTSSKCGFHGEVGENCVAELVLEAWVGVGRCGGGVEVTEGGVGGVGVRGIACRGV